MKPYTDIEQSRLNTMTQEEKAKAYDKAVERAKSKIKNDKDHVLYEDDVIELFPELAESEDEKTRKEITEFFKNFSEHGTWKAISDVTRWIAWLEKQGEKPNNVYDKELSEILGCVIRRYINDPNISYTEREKVSKKIIPYVERLEKQGEQNTANKVEPKFKVGDWIAYNRNDSSREILYVYDIRDGRYYFNDNIHFSWSVKECDEKYHLWTIDDVKDGDVVAMELFGTYEKPFVAIYKGRGLDHFVSYCFTSFDGKFNEGTGGHCLNVHPATKEQCEQLEKAMTDAGFTFDFDKKELKKIEKNPAWSEEDDDYFDAIIAKLEVTQEDAALTDNQMNFLKSLKGKMQPKQEWSEEDEYVFNKILNWCVLVNPTSSIFEELPKDKFVEIFKSLKDRVQSQIIAGDNQCK